MISESSTASPHMDGVSTLNLHPTMHTQAELLIRTLPDGAKTILAILKLCLEHFLSIYSLVVEVWFRVRWGMRGFSMYQLFQMVGLGLVGLFGGFLGQDPLLAGFLITSAALTIYHKIEARQWLKKGQRYWRVTLSEGEPLSVWKHLENSMVKRRIPLSWLCSEQGVFRLGEPLLGYAVALLILPFSASLSIVLIVCSTALLLKRQILWNRQVEAVWDQLDAAKIAEDMASIHDPQTASGSQVPSRVRIADGLRSILDPRNWPSVIPQPIVVPVAVKSPQQESTKPKLSTPVRIRCSQCAASLKVHGKPGTERACPRCKMPFQIPESGPDSIKSASS